MRSTAAACAARCAATSPTRSPISSSSGSRGKVPYFTRAVIETTGLADPAPVLHALMSDPIVAERYMIDGVVTTVDAVNGAGTLDRQPEAVKQAAVADRLIADQGRPRGRRTAGGSGSAPRGAQSRRPAIAGAAGRGRSGRAVRSRAVRSADEERRGAALAAG